MSYFLKEWKKETLELLETARPDIDRKELKKIIEKIIDKNLIDQNCILDNNYLHKQGKTSLLSLYDWIKDNKPIIAGHGVLFKNQDQAVNPNAKMLIHLLDHRKVVKDEMKKCDAHGEEYKKKHRQQNNLKVAANSEYGASGAKSARFFNLYTASATTSTAQSLITTTATAFEAFLANNTPFYDNDDCLLFINNIRKEKREYDDTFLPNITVDTVMKRLKKTYKYKKDMDEDLIFSVLINLNSSDLKRIYYKNNLMVFSKLPQITSMMSIIINMCDSFKNPYKVPDKIARHMDVLWDIYREFVFYNYPTYDRVNRIKHGKRKRVIALDTDSNMPNIDQFVSHVMDIYIEGNKDLNEGKFMGCNILCFLLGKMIQETLGKYCDIANVLPKFKPRINMKNEFFYTTMILTPTKKRYMGSIRLQEGKEILPEKVDLKGIDFIKSTANDYVKKFFKDIVKEKLLFGGTINIQEILNDLNTLSSDIKTSLSKGEKTFLTPQKVKEIEAYDTPMSNMGIRGALIWNWVYPDNEIELPSKLDIVKVKMVKESHIRSLETTNPEIYKILMENIFENPDKKISSKGINYIAIPQKMSCIPEWIIPFIDTDTVILDNVKKFFPVLESLGLKIIKTKSDTSYYSNIVSF